MARSRASKPTQSTGPKGITDAKVIEALKASAGIIAHAALQLGIDRSGLHRRIQRSERLLDALAEIEDTVLDRAEGVILEAIFKRSDPQIAKWFLSTKGRARGYGYRDPGGSFTDDALKSLVDAVAADGLPALLALRNMIA